MSFSWQAFCDSQRIHYVTEGPSWTPGNINVKCPFCGLSDLGHHMGLHLRTTKWHCWRDDSHSGRKPHRLIMALLHCGYAEADSHVAEEKVDLSHFHESVKEFMSRKKPKEDDSAELKLLSDFRTLDTRRGRARMYFDYMVHEREFPERDIYRLCETYDLHYCDQGRWHGRIIVPIYLEDELVGWTGRTVYKKEKIRYKSLSHRPNDYGDPVAPMNIRDVIYNYDNVVLDDWNACVIVEGVFDTFKIDFYGQEYGVCSVANFGTGMRNTQLELLEDIRDHCAKLYHCSDVGAEFNERKISSKTMGLGVKRLPLPKGVKDPGALSMSQAIKMAKSIERKLR